MRVRVLGGGALVLLVLGLAVYGIESSVRVWQLQREIEGLRHEIAVLGARADALGRSVDSLRNDPAAIEKIAREELGLVRDGDEVLRFPSSRRPQ